MLNYGGRWEGRGKIDFFVGSLEGKWMGLGRKRDIENSLNMGGKGTTIKLDGF